MGDCGKYFVLLRETLSIADYVGNRSDAIYFM
jgi:hypothetical protein